MNYLPLISIFLIATAYAQQLPLTVYSPRNGVLFAGVNSVFQDNEGWMWFTSSYNVVRYDGHEFKAIPLADDVEMNFCYDVIGINDAHWVLAQPYPLKIVADTLERLNIELSPYLSRGVNVDGQTYFLDKHGLVKYRDDAFLPVITDSTLNFTHGEHLYTWKDSLVISWQHETALVVFDLQAKVAFTHPMPVSDIAKDAQENILILLNSKGIYSVNAIAGPAFDTSLYVTITDPDAKFIEADAQGNVYVGVPDKHLLRVNPDQSVNTFTESDGLPSLWFLDMYRDREGNVWIGFNNGLCKIRNTPWRRFTKEQGLHSNYIFFFIEQPGPQPPADNGKPWVSITQDATESSSSGTSHQSSMIHHSSSIIYIGTYSGLNVFSANTLHPVRVGDQPFVCKAMLFQMVRNDILRGTQIQTQTHSQTQQNIYFINENKLFSAILDTRSFQVSEEKLLAELPGSGLHLAQDTRGTIFIATNAGLFMWHQNKLIRPVQGDTHYHLVYVDHQQRLWVAAFANGLEGFQIEYTGGDILLHPLIIHAATTATVQFVKQVRAISEDREDHLYAGTRYNGLYQLQVKDDTVTKITHYSITEGLNSNSIWGISIDANDDCWIATARGLNKLNTHDHTISDQGSHAQIYTSAAVHAANDGTIWTASHPGIVLLDPETQDSKPFSVFLTSTTVNTKPVSTSYPVLSYTENTLQFTFSANTFLDEGNVRYAYRLSKNDNALGSRKSREEWSMPTEIHSIHFPSLEPGRYLFSVKAINNSGIWSDNEAQYAFTIRPPFWQHAWFIGLLTAIAFGIVYALYRFRIRQLTQLQQMRNNISRNLHDDIGASLSNINILNALAVRHLRTPEKAGSYLDQASEDIQRISESLSDIVWNVNPMNDDLDQVYSHMKRYAADMLEGKNIVAEFDFPLQGGKTHLSMDKRRDFFLIFKEAVNNMTKYSQATKAKIRIRQEGNMLLLQIEDNGIGFDPKIVKAGNGLHNMRQRAANWGASLVIDSKQGKGTRVVLRVRV